MRTRRWLTRGLWLVLALVLMAGVSRVARATNQAKSVEVLRRDGEMTILPNGDVRVAEVWEVHFIGGPFHYAFREIPLRHVEDITDWSVSENGQPYQEGQKSAGGFVVYKSSQARKITWYFSSTSDATRTFVLSYTLKSALWIDPKGDQLFWKFIEKDRSYPIDHASVLVHLPAAFKPEQLRTATYVDGQEGSPAQMVDAQTLRFEGGPFPGGTEWEIRVQWPHGVVSASPPAWQKEAERQPWIDLGMAVLLFLLVVGVVGGGFLLWYLRGRDPAVGDVPALVTQPPSNLPPGLVGTLIDERADMDLSLIHI